MAAIGGEQRNVGIDSKGVIAPVPGSDHPPVKVEDSRQLPAVECNDCAPIPDTRERRDDAQALFTLGCGWRAALIIRSSVRSAAISSSSSQSFARTGSTSSPHGVP